MLEPLDSQGKPRLGTVSGIGSNGEPLNPRAMTASEIYRAAFAVNGRTPARR